MIGVLADLLAEPRRSRLRAQAFRSLAILVGSGVHIVRALGVLEQQMDDEEFSRCFELAGRQIQQGHPLSRALAHGPFSRLHLQLIAVGERTGALHNILTRLGDQSERSQGNSLRVFSALTYPCVVLLVTLVLVFLAQQFVLRGLLEMLQGLGTPLPWPTLVLAWCSRQLNNPWSILLGLLAGMGLLALLVRFYDPLRNFLYRAPLIGPVLRLALTIEVLRSLTLCQQTGVPVLTTLTILGFLDPILSQPMHLMRKGLEEGDTLSEVWARTDFFPPVVSQVLRAGEESGSTVDLLVNTANLLEMQLEESLASVSAALQPCALLLVALLVGFVLVATLLPLLQVAGGL